MFSLRDSVIMLGLPTPGILGIKEFDILLTVFFTAGIAFAAWLSRHEKWFRDIVFPLQNALSGNRMDPTDSGYFEDAADRFRNLEHDLEDCRQLSVESRREVRDLREEVKELGDRQDSHNEDMDRWLRRIFETVHTPGEGPTPLSEAYSRPLDDDTERGTTALDRRRDD